MAKSSKKPPQQSLVLDGHEGANSAAAVMSDTTPDYLKIAKTVRIAVSGDVFLTKLEKEIIDTPDFQRLPLSDN